MKYMRNISTAIFTNRSYILGKVRLILLLDNLLCDSDCKSPILKSGKINGLAKMYLILANYRVESRKYAPMAKPGEVENIFFVPPKVAIVKVLLA